MRKLGLPDSDQNVSVALSMAGAPITEVFAILYPDRAEQTADYFRLYQERADEIMTVSTSMLPGVREAVLTLDAAGVKLAIVSTKLRARIEDFLQQEGMLPRFATIVGPEDVPTYKPDPEGLLLALARLEVPLNEALYIGDTLIDSETAQRAGVAFMGALSGFTSREQFAAYPALGCIDNVADLPALILE